MLKPTPSTDFAKVSGLPEILAKASSSELRCSEEDYLERRATAERFGAQWFRRSVADELGLVSVSDEGLRDWADAQSTETLLTALKAVMYRLATAATRRQSTSWEAASRSAGTDLKRAFRSLRGAGASLRIRNGAVKQTPKNLSAVIAVAAQTGAVHALFTLNISPRKRADISDPTVPVEPLEGGVDRRGDYAPSNLGEALAAPRFTQEGVDLAVRQAVKAARRTDRTDRARKRARSALLLQGIRADRAALAAELAATKAAQNQKTRRKTRQAEKV